MNYMALLLIFCASHAIASSLGKSFTLGEETSLADDDKSASHAIASSLGESLNLGNGTSLDEDDKTYPPGIKFLGGGYNLIEGNPNNRRSDNGGADPGLLPSNRILKFTVSDKTTTEGHFDLYNEITYTPRSSCVRTESHSIVKDTKSYQDELSAGVSLGASYDSPLVSAGFTASAEYKKMTEETISNKKVFYEERTTCLYGDASYSWSNLERGRYHVTDNFASNVCNLPETYEESKYRSFVETFGTHVIWKADLGTKTIKLFESTTAEFTEFALEQNKASVSVEAGYGGVSASLSVDFSKLKQSTKEGCQFGSESSDFTIGTEERPEPIKIKIKPLTELFVKKMYNADDLEATNCVLDDASLEQRKNNLLDFFAKYPTILGVVLPEDQDVKLDLNWPKGTYGLPRPEGECPTGKDFTWHEGRYYQDNEDDNHWQTGSDGNHLGIEVITEDQGQNYKNSQQRFCVKTVTTSNNMAWPRGSYCINKKGACPNGFGQGSVTWYDETSSNDNERSGTLPDGGQFGSPPRTKVEYCCRADDYPENQIFLPFDKPFLLYMAPGNHNCQQVYKMNVRAEWFSWNVSDEKSSESEGSVPEGVYNRNIKQFYCYYTPK